MTVKIKTFRYFIRDAAKNMWRNPLMSLASVGSVIAVLVLMGVFLIIMFNIQHLAGNLESDIEIKAFLDLDIEQERIDAIERKIKGNKKIESVKFESKEEALENFKEQIGDREDLLQGFDENNPMQYSFILKMKNPRDFKEVSEYVGDIEGVEEVVFREELVNTLLQSTYLARVITGVLTVILSAVSIFIISNTIKLTVFARKREINIMKYVGATNWYVRWPFLLEGAFLGIIGALFSALILGYSYYYFTGLSQSTAFSAFSQSLVPAGDLMGQVALFVIITGLFIGSLGSILSIRKFLRV